MVPCPGVLSYHSIWSWDNLNLIIDENNLTLILKLNLMSITNGSLIWLMLVRYEKYFIFIIINIKL